MKSSKVLFLFLSVMLVAGNAFAKDAKKKVEKTDSLQFTVIKENPITSVKNQNKSGTCWSYSSLGFFEAWRNCRFVKILCLFVILKAGKIAIIRVFCSLFSLFKEKNRKNFVALQIYCIFAVDFKQ